MIFSARSRLPLLAASHAWSANLRARRRSFTFCFLGFIRSSLERGNCRLHFWGYGNTARRMSKLVLGTEHVAIREGARNHPSSVRNALTQEDLMDHSHNKDCKRRAGTGKAFFTKRRLPALRATPATCRTALGAGSR